MSGPRRRAGWAWWPCLAILVGALVVGSWPRGAPPTALQRASAIDAVVRCPSCEGLSVADSSSSTSQAIRVAVLARVRQGQSDAQVKAFLVSRYGPEILLRPPTRGVAGLVWLVPVVALAGAAVGLGVVFWRRRAQSPPGASDADRDLVEAALATGPGSRP